MVDNKTPPVAVVDNKTPHVAVVDMLEADKLKRLGKVEDN